MQREGGICIYAAVSERTGPTNKTWRERGKNVRCTANSKTHQTLVLLGVLLAGQVAVDILEDLIEAELEEALRKWL
jgi:hypothetical protein